MWVSNARAILLAEDAFSPANDNNHDGQRPGHHRRQKLLCVGSNLLQSGMAVPKHRPGRQCRPVKCLSSAVRLVGSPPSASSSNCVIRGPSSFRHHTAPRADDPKWPEPPGPKLLRSACAPHAHRSRLPPRQNGLSASKRTRCSPYVKERRRTPRPMACLPCFLAQRLRPCFTRHDALGCAHHMPRLFDMPLIVLPRANSTHTPRRFKQGSSEMSLEPPSNHLQHSVYNHLPLTTTATLHRSRTIPRMPP